MGKKIAKSLKKMHAKDNPFSAEIFYGYTRIMVMKYVQSEAALVKWLDLKKITYTNINFYDRKTGEFLYQKTGKNNDEILAIKKEQLKQKK
jgi:hypothetical protein